MSISPAAQLVQLAAQRVLRRHAEEAVAEPQPQLSPLEWATQNAIVIHPVRGRIPFEPYPYQATFLDDRSPLRIVLKARQVGFSQAVALDTAWRATQHPDRTILLVSRNQDLAVNLLYYVKAAISQMTSGVPTTVKDNTEEISFANGSRIMSLPANRSTGRGYAASDVYLDEFAFQDYAEDIYQSVSPTISHGGTMTVVSTANGRGNLYFRLWRGFEGGDWSKHLVPWQECPVYDDEWYQRERPRYTAQQWASEYECDFVESGAAVFAAVYLERCADGWLGLQPGVAGRQYVTFWDIGRRRDATVGITLDVTDGTYQVVAYERMLGIPYPVIQQHITERFYAYPGVHGVESNSPGDPVIENLTVPVLACYTSHKSKIDMITALQLAIEQGRFKHGVEQLGRELELYQWDDRNLIQDSVMAAAGACYLAGEPPRIDEIVTLDDDDWVSIGPSV